MRYRVVPAHGEHRTLYYVVDGEAPEQEQPAVVETFERREQAEGYASELEKVSG